MSSCSVEFIRMQFVNKLDITIFISGFFYSVGLSIISETNLIFTFWRSISMCPSAVHTSSHKAMTYVEHIYVCCLQLCAQTGTIITLSIFTHRFSATSNATICAFLYMNFKQFSRCFYALHDTWFYIYFMKNTKNLYFFPQHILQSHVWVFFISYEESRITRSFVIVYDSTFSLNNWLSQKCVKILYYVIWGYLDLTFSFFYQK